MTSAKKSLGQHWLKDDTSLQAVVQASGVQKGDNVLEIGPGRGDLTQRLLDIGANVIAVELDSQLIPHLKQKFFAAKNFQLYQGDVMQFDLSQMGNQYKVAANIPYYLTGQLVRMLLTVKNKPSQIGLLVQKEVAERLAARPGSLSILGVIAQLYSDVSLGPVVTADKFSPPPKVDSQIVTLKPRTKPLFEDTDYELLIRLVKAGFSNKRKKIKSSLAGGLNMDKSEVEHKLKNAGIDPNFRAQQLDLEDWHKIYQSFSSN